MFLLDKIENLSHYPEYAPIAAFLASHEEELSLGIHPVCDGIFVNSLCYETKEGNRFEGHVKNIDFQVMLDGEEYMQVGGKEDATLTVPYDEEKDAAFYTVEKSHRFYFGKGYFAVLTPNDLHCGALPVKKEGTVKKYVFKIAVK